jgi:hypothetical protein
MKCLHCESAIPLVQSVVRRGAPFCCDGHRKAYFAESQRLMLNRLMESRNRYARAVLIVGSSTPYVPEYGLSKERSTAILVKLSTAVLH